MMSLRQLALNDHRNLFFLSLSAIVSPFALSPDSSIYPIIGFLSILLVYTPFLFRIDAPYRKSKIGLLIGLISIGSSLSRLKASRNALSTAGSSSVALLAISTILSALGVTTIYIYTRNSTRLTSPWSRVALFPAVWATLWCTVSYINPVGYLATWSPANNVDAYNWLVPYLGPIVKDWVIAAWAVVISETVTLWFMGENEAERMPLLNYPGASSQPSHSNTRDTQILALISIVLLVPDSMVSKLPIPISNVDVVTPLTVGCVLPSLERYGKHVLDIDDYIAESTLISSQARVILWPEGAVTFRSTEERDKAFQKIRTKLTGTYVGVSFEETITDPRDPSGKRAVSRTGLAVVSQYSNETQHIYYKQHLVPFVVSSPLRHSTTPPTIIEAEIHRPSSIPKTRWGHAPNYTRPILITSSICLDFATPSPFKGLEAKPNLILAPARTWDPVVGNAMWLQARQRATELDSTILWCDGGEGGISGIAGGGFNDATQVGLGTFVRTFGVPYPLPKSRPTFYGRFGSLGLLLAWILVILDPRNGLQLVSRQINNRRNRKTNGETRQSSGAVDLLS